MTDLNLPADVIALPHQYPFLNCRDGEDRCAFSVIATIGRKFGFGVHLTGPYELNGKETVLALVLHREPSKNIAEGDVLFQVRATNDGFRVFDARVAPTGPLHATALDALFAILDICPDTIEGMNVRRGASALRLRLETTRKRLSAGEIRYANHVFYKPLFDFKGGLVLGRVVGWTNLFGIMLPDIGDPIVIDETFSLRYGFIRRTGERWVVMAYGQRAGKRNWPEKISRDKRTYCDASASFGASVGNLMRLFLNDGNSWLTGHEMLERVLTRKAVRAAVRGKASPDDAFGTVAGI